MSEGLRSPRRLGLGDTCAPPMSAKDKATPCECGHLGSDHRHPLPAPCRHGWDEKALRETIDNAHNCGLSTVFATDIEMDRQLAAGACPCIAFSPRTTMIHFTAATHIGRRTTQEDSFIAEPPFFAVADGMGGHGSGDVASRELLTRCVQARGGELEWEPEYMGRFDVEEGDELILCTDGVSKVLKDLAGSAEDLVQRAIEAGGKDNATAIVITLKV